MQIFGGKRFEEPIKVIQAFDNESFFEAFSQIEELRKRLYLLGYIRYEAKDIFLNKQIKSEFPLLYFEVYSHCEEEAFPDAALQEKEFGLIQPRLYNDAMITYKKYSKAIEKIKEEIACGNTYQVNYTYDYKIEADLSSFELYESILPRQITPYNAYIKNEYEEILSFSPELFFELDGNKIKTKPMKGTIKRGANINEDLANIEFLRNDIKNRAENVMIVDLLRNDLGKIAKTGTVKVDKLFEIETHSTVHQMTSEISAELEENTTLFDIFEAIFPCGSVTGTPKINTMKIIDELEIGKRDVYCGAIGLISPEKTVFSVPIRILQRQRGEKFFLCRVGGAIVWDSTPKDEWEETFTKIRFLQNSSSHCEEGEAFPDVAIQEKESGLLQPRLRNDVRGGKRDYYALDIKLVETMMVENEKIQYKNEHFFRMKKSANELGFKFVSPQEIKTPDNCIIRFLLDKEGILETQILPLDEIKTNKVTVSKTPVKSKEALLYHKTTYRPWYEGAMKRIKSDAPKYSIFDEIFFNEKGELTEGARSNIVLQINGEFFTPPVECGLLNGILRQKILKEGANFATQNSRLKSKLTEKKLYLKDLKNAEKVFCINSVRGIVEAEVIYDFD